MIRVVTADGALADLNLPISRISLEDVRAERRSFVVDEEKAVIAFARSVSISDKPFPLDGERFTELIGGSRTKTS